MNIQFLTNIRALFAGKLQKLKELIARPDPDDMDSGYPEATQPIPTDMRTPGEDTHAMMVQRFPSPSAWDSLSDRRNKRKE